MKVPPSYLITGLPRCRSAWLAAVLSTPDLPCVHDRASVGWPIDYAHGLSDPTVACVNPHVIVTSVWRDSVPVVIIERDGKDSYESFRAFASRGGLDVTPDRWDRLVQSFEWFKEQVTGPGTLTVPYDLLDCLDVVRGIGRHVGVHLSPAHVDHFQHLHIEQSIKCLQSHASV